MLATSNLTKAERLIVDRRRRGESLKKAAKRLRVSLYVYRKWEAGHGTPRVSVGALSAHESYFLMRLRRGMSQGDLAEAMDVSQWWLCQMERGDAPVDLLETYWAA